MAGQEDDPCTNGPVQEALLEEGRKKDDEEAASDGGQPESEGSAHEPLLAGEGRKDKEAASDGDEPESEDLPSFDSFASFLQQLLGMFFPAFFLPILDEKLPVAVSFLQKFYAEDLEEPFSFHQQLLAEFCATLFLIFAGGGAITVNIKEDMAVTSLGVAVVWGTVVMAMIYSVGHISGAHMNPAITLGFAVSGRFPWRKVPAYMLVQTVAATVASLVLRLIFRFDYWGYNDRTSVMLTCGRDYWCSYNQYRAWEMLTCGRDYWCSYNQSLAIEFIMNLCLMFVVMAVATNYRAVGLMAGLAVGGTIMLNVLLAGPLSGASIPARSIVLALVVWSDYRSLWVYIVGPFAGAACGARVYNLIPRIRNTGSSLDEIIVSRNPAN